MNLETLEKEIRNEEEKLSQLEEEYHKMARELSEMGSDQNDWKDKVSQLDKLYEEIMISTSWLLSIAMDYADLKIKILEETK